MIQKLRSRFILLSMSALLAVLAVILVGMNLTNYLSVVHDADELLQLLSHNRGHFPSLGEPLDKPMPELSPEAPYQTRYFSVLLSSDGSVILAETGSIAAVDTAQAIELARSVTEKDREQGFAGDYRYRKFTENGNTRIIFLDCGQKLEAFRSFLYAGILICLCGFTVVFLILWLLSPRIIRPIAESYEKQKRFITDAGHEIKTPLTIIAADADVLEMEIGENEWLEDIKKQSAHLAALTNELVNLSRVEETDRKPAMLPFPISDVVEETAASFHAPALSQGKTLQLRISPMLSMRGDEKALRQLVSILLDNALKYSPEGSTISLTLERQGKGLRLSAANPCAAALTQEDVKHMFDRFYRADPSRNSKTGGFGLGLSIAQAIVSAHAGKLTATAQRDTLEITALFPA